MTDFTFERVNEAWDKLTVFPPTPASLALAQTFGVELAQAYLTDSPEVADKDFEATIREISGYEGVSGSGLPLDAFVAFAGAAQNTVSYVRARAEIVRDLGTEVVASLDGLVGASEVSLAPKQ